MSRDGDGSITGWIAGLKSGDPGAAQPLWERYFARMVDLARAMSLADNNFRHDANWQRNGPATSSRAFYIIRIEFPRGMAACRSRDRRETAPIKRQFGQGPGHHR